MTRAKARKAPHPGPIEPTWTTRPALMTLKGSGMPPQKVTRLEVRLPDGTLASRKEADALVAWPSVRLRVVFDEHHRWWGSRGTAWHRQAIATALELAALVSPTSIVQDTIDRWDEPVLKPSPYGKREAAKYLARTLFAEEPPHPWTVLRGGDRLSVRYDRSLLALSGSVQVFLPPTNESVALLDRTLDDLAGRVSFAWAGVGFGLAGWASALALVRDGSSRVLLPERREQRQPAMDADWLVWLGDRWRPTPAPERAPARQVEWRGSRLRITVPRPTSPEDARGAKHARRLRADLRTLARKHPQPG